MISIVVLGTATAYAQPFSGKVRLENTSALHTSFEVGQTLRVIISGAAPNAPIQFWLGANGPYYPLPPAASSTDGSGNFSMDVSLGSGSVGQYEETWWVTPAGQSTIQVEPWNDKDALIPF